MFIYNKTESLCEDCLQLVEANIVFENNYVYLYKYCPQHNLQKTLIATDINYYKKCVFDATSHNYPPDTYKNKIITRCPYDCGLCVEHKQHTAMGIIEVLDECDLECPTCIASSHPGAGKIKSIKDIEKMLDTLIEYEKIPDLVMISGGEPTIHPDIIQILELAKSKPIKHLMLITNGIRIAQDPDFINYLKQIKQNFEIYLQFDSLNPEVLIDIRGKNLTDIRLRALENLESAEIHSTLVCVVKNGVNENEMNKIINLALGYKYIRGVTFQPCKITGRNEKFNKNINYITLSEVRKNIIKTSEYFSEDDLIPHPLNPEGICIGYLSKSPEAIIPVTKYLYNDEKLNGICFPYKNELAKKMYFLQELNSERIKYESLFRVAIVSFLDKFNFSTSTVKKSCIHFVTMKGDLIPLDTYYLLYQNKD